MAFVFNGVIIPENVANAFYLNGTNITDIFVNGVQVWNQSLFSASWSGNSYVGSATTRNSNCNINTSGSAFRSAFGNTTGTITDYGDWLYSSAPHTVGNGSSNAIGLGTSIPLTASSVYIKFDGGAWVTHTLNVGFSGTSSIINGYSNFYLETSSGLMRTRHRDTVTGANAYGAWISLV